MDRTVSHSNPIGPCNLVTCDQHTLITGVMPAHWDLIQATLQLSQLAHSLKTGQVLLQETLQKIWGQSTKSPSLHPLSLSQNVRVFD